MPIITLSLYWSKISGYNLTSGGLRGKSFNLKFLAGKLLTGKLWNAQWIFMIFPVNIYFLLLIHSLVMRLEALVNLSLVSIL